MRETREAYFFCVDVRQICYILVLSNKQTDFNKPTSTSEERGHNARIKNTPIPARETLLRPAIASFTSARQHAKRFGLQTLHCGVVAVPSNRAWLRNSKQTLSCHLYPTFHRPTTSCVRPGQTTYSSYECRSPWETFHKETGIQNHASSCEVTSYY